MPAGAIIGGAVSLIGGIFGSSRAKREASRRKQEANRLQSKLNRLEANRQQIINPYDNVTDLSSMLSNPFASLSVATQAAEMQMEQTDQALANTLDAMRATGAGAGGATALAQAAAQSKQGISASIEGQEAQNEKLRAQGQTSVNQQLMNIEQMAIGEETAAFQRQDTRDQALLDRAYGESDFLRSRQMQMEDASQAALMAGVSGTTSLLTSGFSEGGFFSDYYQNK